MDPLEEQWWKDVETRVHPGQLRAWVARFWAVAERTGLPSQQLDVRFGAFRRGLLRALTSAIETRAKALSGALAVGSRKEAERALHREPLLRELEQLVADELERALGSAGLANEPPGAGDALYIEWLQSKLGELAEVPRTPPSAAAVELRRRPNDRAAREVYVDSLLAAGEVSGELAQLYLSGKANAWRAELRLELDDSLGPLGWLPVDFYWRDGLVEHANLSAIPVTGFAASITRYVLGHPLCAAVEHLHLLLDEGEAVLSELVATGAQPQLKALHLLDDYRRDSRVDLSRVTPLLPGLESLSLQASELVLGPLELPRLEWLMLSLGASPDEVAAELAQARCGALKGLSIMHHGYYDDEGERHYEPWSGEEWVQSLATALSKRTPALLTLAMPIAAEALATLAPALERPQLTSFALTRRALDAHARALLGLAPRLAHLKQLFLRSDDADPELTEALQRALPDTDVGWFALDEQLPLAWWSVGAAAKSG